MLRLVRNLLSSILKSIMSSKRVKNKTPAPKIKSAGFSTGKCNLEKDQIYFCFKYICGNKRYNFDQMDKEKGGAGNKSHKEFVKLLRNLSYSTWESLGRLGKDKGFETIEISELNCDITRNYKERLSPDTKLHIFRFGHGNCYRMIGYKSETCIAVLHILAFDYDYTLYDHGS